MPITYISLFSGGFGLDLGMEAAGFEVAACVEWSAAMRQTIKENRKDVKVIGDLPDEFGGDVYHIPPQLVLERSGMRVGEPDIIVGGPPCQSFSILGKRQGLSDPRGSLMLKFVDMVSYIQPKCFVLENVSGLLTLQKGAVIEQIIDALKNAGSDFGGYTVFKPWKLNAVEYGVPQFRERIFLIGFRGDMSVQEFGPPIATHRPDYSTMKPSKDLFEDAERKLDTRPVYITSSQALRAIPIDAKNNEKRPHGVRVSTRYADVEEGNRDSIDHTDRLHRDRPSGTVLVGSGGGGGRPFIHFEEDRHLTVREAATLQAFPIDWIFYGTQTEQYRMVGNAVPPPLAEAVARRIKPYILRAKNRVGTEHEVSAASALELAAA